jgi:ABC-type sulfate transport system permease component
MPAMEGLLTAAEWEALGLSLRVALVAVLSTLPFAFLAALLLARCQFRGKALVDGLIHLPLVLPPVALGYLLLISLGTRAPLGAFLLDNFGIRFVFSWTGAALASAILTFPFQVRAIRLSLEAQDRGLAEAAETLGASAFDRLFSLYLPLAVPGFSAARSPRSPPASASSARSSPSSPTFPAKPAPSRSRSTPRSRAPAARRPRRVSPRCPSRLRSRA